MAEEVAFGQYSGKKKSRVLYTPKHGEFIRIRFVGKQLKIYGKWDQDENGKHTLSYHENVVPDSHPRIVSLVIDRSDEEVKVYDCPMSAWKQVGQNGEPNHDFQITRMGFGMKTRYEAKSMGESFVGDELNDSIAITLETYPLVDMIIKKVDWELLEVVPEPIDNRFDILDL